MPLSKALLSKAGKASWKKGQAHFTKARRNALAKARKQRSKISKESRDEFTLNLQKSISKMNEKELFKNLETLAKLSKSNPNDKLVKKTFDLMATRWKKVVKAGK
jgi:hypothetical protein